MDASVDDSPGDEHPYSRDLDELTGDFPPSPLTLPPAVESCEQYWKSFSSPDPCEDSDEEEVVAPKKRLIPFAVVIAVVVDMALALLGIDILLTVLGSACRKIVQSPLTSRWVRGVLRAMYHRKGGRNTARILHITLALSSPSTISWEGTHVGPITYLTALFAMAGCPTTGVELALTRGTTLRLNAVLKKVEAMLMCADQSLT
jgi:hypothetical protein